MATATPGTQLRRQATTSLPPVVHVHAGDVVTAADPTRMVTILGSCVAVCLYDPESGVAGMNHFLYPDSETRQNGDRARFGEGAILELLGSVLERGARRELLRAKVFGGACPKSDQRWRGQRTGARNVETALATLSRMRIPVTAKDVGGTNGRRVEFHTGDTSVYVKRV